MNFRYKIAEFFSGRYIYYGIDLLTKLLAALCILLSVINLFIGSYLIYLLETSLLIWIVFKEYL